jgi:hypothetical protein
MPVNDIPGRNGVTAPITPDSRTTGTTDRPRRHRAGIQLIHFSIAVFHDRASLEGSVIPLPQILTVFYLPAVIELTKQSGTSAKDAAEQVMKIYLLVMLIGTLLTAIHFTSAPKQAPKPISQ